MSAVDIIIAVCTLLAPDHRHNVGSREIVQNADRLCPRAAVFAIVTCRRSRQRFIQRFFSMYSAIVQPLFQPLHFSQARNNRVTNEVKRLHVIRVELPKQQNEIEVHVIADVHLSDPNCDIRGVQKRVADIAAKDNAYAILAGDLIDNATRSSIGDIYSTQLSPMEQIKLANKTFAPLKGRILCAVPGNHEERTYRADGIDITWLIANELGAGDRYAPDAALVFVSLGENSRRKSEGRQTTYSIYVNHGNGACLCAKIQV